MAGNAIAAIAIVDLQYRFKFANEEMARIFGYDSIAEIMAIPASLDLVHPEDAERMRRIGKDRLQGEPVPNGYEFRGIRKDGSEIWLTNAVRVIEWEGEPAFEFVCVDITARKRAEDALRESEERYRDLVENSLAAIFVHRDFRILFANEAFARLVGCESVEDLMRTGTLLDFIPREDRAGWIEAHADRLAGRPRSSRHERRFLSRDARIVRAELIARRVMWSGQPASQIAVFDLSERERAERALKESEERYRDLVEGSLQPIYVHRDFKLLFANRAFAKLLGFESVERTLEIRSLLDHAPPEDLELWTSGYRRRVTGEKTSPVLDRVFLTRDGRRLHLLIIARRIKWAGEDAVQATLFDLTYRDRAEEALRASEQRYRSLVEGALQGIVVHREFKPLFANRTLANMFGFETAEELMRVDDMLVFLPPEQREKVLGFYQDRIAGKPVPEHYEVEWIHRDGSSRWMDVESRVVEWEGAPAVQSSMIDTTARKRAQSEQEASERRYRDLTEASLQGVVVSRDNRILFANPSEANAFGFGNAKEMIGLDLDTLYTPESNLRRHQRRAALKEFGGILPTAEFEGVRRDGTPVWIETRSREISWDGAPALMAVHLDITDRKRAELALRMSETRYRDLVSLSLLGIAVIHDGTVLYANPAAAAMFGIASPEQFVGESFLDFVAPEDAAELIRRREHPIGDPLPVIQVQLIRRDTRETTWIETQAVNTMWEGKRVKLATYVDITQRKRAEQALRERESLLNGLLDHAPALIYVRNPEGRFLVVNREYQRNSGMSPERLLGKRLEEVYPPHLAEQFGRHDADVLRTKSSFNYEETVERNGKRQEFLTLRFPLLDQSGNVTAICGISTEITDRKRAEQALQESEERYRDLIENSPQGIMIQRDRRFVFVNRAYARLYGYSDPAEIIALGTTDRLIHPDERDRLIGYQTARMNGRPAPDEYVFRAVGKDGHDILVQNTIRRIRWDGAAAIQAIAVDITERVKAERALRDSEERYRNLVDNALQGITVVDRHGEIVFANGAMASMFGYREPQAIIGRPLKDLIVPGQLRQFLEHRARRLDGESSVGYREWEGVRADGQPVWFGHSVAATDWHAQPAIQDTFLDVSERRRAEQAVQASEQRYRDLVEGSLQGMFIHRDFHLLFANRAFAEMLGYPSPESLKELESLLTVVAPNERERIQAYGEARIRGEGAPERFELGCLRRDGQPILFEFQSRAIAWDGQRAIQSTVFNITERKRAEQALRESERRFRDLLENSPLGTFVHMGLRFVYVNRAFARIYGYASPDEVMALGHTETLVHPDDRPRLAEIHVHRLKGEDAPEQYEFRGVRKDGSVIWARNHVRRIVWEGQTATQTITVDITEPKRAEAALRDSEERYRDLVEGSLQGMMIRADSEILFANQALVDMLGYPSVPELLALKDPDNLIPPHEIVRLTAYRKARLSGQPAPSHYECEMDRYDGRRILVEVQARIVNWRERKAIQLTVYDVTERKRAERAVEDSRVYLASVLDTALDAIITVDKSGSIETFNRAAEKIFGYAREEVMGRDVAMLVPPEHQSAHQGYIERYLRTGISQIIGIGRETEGLRRGGTRFPVSIEVSEVRHQDRITFTAIVRDITERKMQEQALVENARAKSAMLSTLSHEMRTPLTSILGFAQLIRRDDNLTPMQRDDLGTIEQSSHHLLELINDVLDVQKMEAGYVQVERGAFDLHAMAESLVNMFRPRAKEKHVAMRLTIEPEVPRWVHGDARKLRQVLINLLGNAAKFTDSGSVELILAAEAPGTVRFSVRDTGPGMSESELKEIMKPFRQFGTSRGGTGLGLAISKGLAEAMGGPLEVRSAIGAGSEFSFSLPLEAQSAAVIEAQQLQEMGAAARSGLRVLIVDDDGRIREWVGRLLRSEGYEVATAEDGREAIRRFAESPPDLVLMDLRMPMMGGMEAIRRIRKMPGGEKVPIFVLSAEVSSSQPAPKDPEAPYELALAKPIEAGQLLDAVGAFLNAGKAPSKPDTH